VSGRDFNITLIPLWEQERPLVLRLGHALHERLPVAEPPVTMHGRELLPEREGVGFQFQYTLNDALYGGARRAAYYVVQAQLVRRKTSIAWQVDAMPVLEEADERYDLFSKRPFSVAFHDRVSLQDLFVNRLASDAQTFFAAVRAGELLEERPTSSGARPLPAG
jgi:hypothetical protein